jgi:hypothetical protein
MTKLHKEVIVQIAAALITGLILAGFMLVLVRSAHAFNDVTANPVYRACPLKPGPRRVKCNRLVHRLARVLGGTLPDCAPPTPPPACPPLSIGQRAARDQTGALYTLIDGILVDRGYPQCVGQHVFGSVAYGESSLTVSGDCQGTLLVGDADQLLLGPDLPFVKTLNGTLQCSCCGALIVNDQFLP